MGARGGAALPWRWDVVERTAEFVVGHDGESVGGAGTLVDRAQDRCDLFITDIGAAVAGVLVARTEFLDEGDRLSGNALGIRYRDGAAWTHHTAPKPLYTR